MINIMYTKKIFLDFFTDKNLEKVLDLGCNKGYMSKRLAKENTEVLGVDKIFFEISQKNFSFIKKDIIDFNFEEEYDLIIASLVLHYFLKKDAINILDKIKKNTHLNGYNFIICISNKDKIALEKNSKYFFPSIEEIIQIYGKEWKVVKSLQSFTEFEEHGKLNKHQHNLIFLIMRKNE